jgi:phage-related tail fiber protein
MSVTQVQTSGIVDDAVISTKIPDGAIGTTELADGAVISQKIGFTINSVPTGAVFHFAASTPPTGYLKCNGNTIPNGTGTVQGITANFSALYAVIESTFGSAGKLPDLRGEFIRGWDDGKGIDNGRVIGTGQDDALQDHTHSGNGLISLGGSQILNNAGLAGRNNQPTGLVSAGYRSAAETRPRNIALLACIKF